MAAAAADRSGACVISMKSRLSSVDSAPPASCQTDEKVITKPKWKSFLNAAWQIDKTEMKHCVRDAVVPLVIYSKSFDKGRLGAKSAAFPPKSPEKIS